MYVLQGIISNRETIESAKSIGAVSVNLPQGKAMIPFTETLREVRGIAFLPLIDGSTKTLPSAIAELCQVLSVQGKVVYIESEFFGGTGSQACSLWDSGEMVGEPQVELCAINFALQYLGVEKGASVDEFEALNLGKYRKIEEWLSSAGA